ncbi:ATP-binding protein [Massilia sp.]|uniref:ATP-binding protein n=1 Tax=Massilia sp. TaxID=1882437 RepID=UPI00289973CF|nr:ATP-binding protein [Massilia sp.]
MNDLGQDSPVSATGGMRALLRTHPWERSALGHPDSWPRELHAAVDIMLVARNPALVGWGDGAVILYNDAYAALLGARHPAALGQPFGAVWPELWSTIGPRVAGALAGTPQHVDDAPALIPTGDGMRQHWFSVSYAPLRLADGTVAGFFHNGFDTTERVNDTRWRRFQLALGERLRSVASSHQIIDAASAMIGAELDAERVIYAEHGETDDDGLVVRAEWVRTGQARAAGTAVRLDDLGAAAAAALRAGAPVAVGDAAAGADGVGAFPALPLLKAGSLATVVIVQAAQPRHWQDIDLRLLQDVAERTWTALDALRAHQALRDSEARLSAVFDSLPVGVGVADPSGKLVLSNLEMRRYLPTGIMPSRDDSRFARWTSYHPDGSQVARHDYPGARALRGERVVPGIEALYRGDDGRETWTHIGAVPIRDADGRITGQVSVVTDIDRVKRAEAQQRLSEEKYRKLFERMDAGFCIVEILFDADGQPNDFRYLELNPMFESQSGLVDARGRTALEMVPGLERSWIERIGAVAVSGVSDQFEAYSAVLGRWYETNASPLGEPGAHLVALIFRDTTERKQNEENLRRLALEDAEASRRKSEFLAVLAHELRNPMAPIRTGLEIMRLRADSPETIERVREMLERQTRQMTHLIDDLLDVARVTSGKIEIRKQLVDLNRVVASAVETSTPVIQGARHTLDLQMWDEALLLDIDPTRIAQVINNLLTNAAKYTPAGGRIALTVRKEGREAVIAVSDSGVGIPLEHQQSIFEMFNQVGRNMGLAQGGLGIGLSLVRQLVLLHGGRVSASSPGVGQGSTFTLRLPLGVQQEAGAGDPALPERRTTQRRTFRILVVDDNTDAAESLSLLLQLNAHEIRTATNGRDALLIAQEFRPDIGFLDIGMPGMTGFELAERLRAMPELAGMTLVAVTGWGSDEDLARSRQAGIDHHFTKPIAADTVSRLLSQIE